MNTDKKQSRMVAPQRLQGKAVKRVLGGFLRALCALCAPCRDDD